MPPPRFDFRPQNDHLNPEMGWVTSNLPRFDFSRQLDPGCHLDSILAAPDLIKATDTYLQNVGGNTSSRNRYESASNLADFGDKIRIYIARIATAAQDINSNSQFEVLAAQIKALTKAVAKLSTGAKSGDENANPNTARVKGTNASRCPQYTKPRNMGAYCHSHGFHPVGDDHTSATCKWKKEGHKDEATWSNWLSGNTFWPTDKAVALTQHNHSSWNSKSAPTN